MLQNRLVDQPTRIRYLVLTWICVAAAIAYIQRTAMGIAAPRIREDLSLSAIEMGWVMSGFFWAYSFAQIPSGYLGQRLGSRRGLVASMVATSALCALVAWSWSESSLLVIWVAAGIAIAGIFPCSVQSISSWFPKSEAAFPSGLLGSSMSLGAAIAAALTGFLLSQEPQSSAEVSTTFGMQSLGIFHPDVFGSGWRRVFVLYSIPGIAWSLGFAGWFRNRPADHAWVNAAELALIQQGTVKPQVESPEQAQVDERNSVPWGKLLLNLSMVMICSQQFFRAAGYAFYGTWLPTYLQQVHGVAAAKAGVLTSMPLIGVIVGGVVAGKIADYVLRRTASRRIGRQMLGGLSPLLTALTALLAWWIHDPWIAVGLLTAGAVLGSFTGCCSYALIIENARPHVAPAFGTMNAIGNLGAAMSPVVIGWLATRYGWHPAMLSFAAFYLLCGLCWIGINPNRQFMASA